MEKDYSKYTVQDFLFDEAFILLAYRGTEEKEIWHTLLKEHPEKTIEMEEARRILHSMTFAEDEISEAQLTSIADKVKQQITAGEYQKKRKNQLSSLYKIAASLVILAIICFGTYRFIDFDEETSTDIPLAAVHKSNPRGQKSKVTLPDGSKVMLNSESKISFPKKFDHGLREVHLEGEAFFEIKKDLEAPFIVYTKALKATVLGTSFNVRSFPEEDYTNVALSTGKVSVATIDSSDIQNKVVVLEPGRQAVYHKGSSKISEGSFDMEEILAWKNKTIYFKQANMADIENKLERWYGVDITVENTARKKVSLSTTFKDQPLSSVLKSLAFTLKFDYQKGKNEVIIRFK
ncbi:DUF4974 domain-containing protein [Fulvivirga sp. M361]|uniref:FecR family protein n=1 Tax=Fulvivirga sp. M361 TaxID=2594266 RepID=UPI00117AD549|nr:FecR domain-containing protein [Fulvivirga sp. M361]TRX59567.1 DUF4974 domain-containing protein [Fulvivirga sp. M361]